MAANVGEFSNTRFGEFNAATHSMIPRETAHKAQYAVLTMCHLLEMSRGWFFGFFASEPARAQRAADRCNHDQAILPQIIQSFKASKRRYDLKRMHKDLIETGEVVSERRVARIIKETKVPPRLVKRRKPITTDRCPVGYRTAISRKGAITRWHPHQISWARIQLPGA